MAPRAQPRSLYRLCVSHVSGLVEQSCVRMFLEQGIYDDPGCRRAISALQAHLLHLLPLTVFEHLGERCRRRVRGKPPLSALFGSGYSKEMFTWISDPRIKHALFLHPAITRFRVDGVMQHDYDVLADDEAFWSSHVRRLENLAHLRLDYMSTDEMLLIVGGCCSKLETVHISSSIEQEVDLSRGGHAVPRFSFNARVTDVGLDGLLGCRNLRRIILDGIVSMNFNDKVTIAGARRLIFGLPKLEFVNFASMGKILLRGGCESGGPLSLTNFKESDLSAVDFTRLQHLLPNLQQVFLTVPSQITPSGDISPQPTFCAAIMEALAASSLRIRFLRLLSFPFCASTRKFLLAKGAFLEELTCSPLSAVGSEEVAFVGRTCPGLRKLTLDNLGPEPSSVPLNRAALRRNPFLRHLRELYLRGKGWSPNAALVALTSAERIESVRFHNGGSRPVSMDRAFASLLRSNKLERLREIRLLTGCLMTISLVRRLCYDLPWLMHFSGVRCERQLDVNEFEMLSAELESQNYDIKLELVDDLWG